MNKRIILLGLMILYCEIYLNAQGSWYRQLNDDYFDDISHLLYSDEYILVFSELQDGTIGVRQMLTCFSENGDTVWQRVISARPSAIFDQNGFTLSNGDFLVGFVVYNYLLSGSHDADTMVMWRLNPINGEILWEYKTPSVLKFEDDYDQLIGRIYDVIEYNTDDIRLYFWITTFRPGDPLNRKRDGYIVLDQNGVEIQRHYYQRNHNYHQPSRILKDMEGNLYQRYRAIHPNIEQGWGNIDKMDSTGQVVWTYRTDTIVPAFGTSGCFSLDDHGNIYSSFLIQPVPDNNFIIHPTLFSLTPQGELRWQRQYENHSSHSLGLTRSIFDNQKRIVSCGYHSNYDIIFSEKSWIICTDTLGNLLWEREYMIDEYIEEGSRFYYLEQTSDGGLIFAGNTEIPFDVEDNSSDVFIVKTDSEGCVVPGCGLYNYITFITSIAQPGEEMQRMILYCSESDLQVQLGNTDRIISGARFMISTLHGVILRQGSVSQWPFRLDMTSVPTGQYVFALLTQDGRLIGSGQFFKP